MYAGVSDDPGDEEAGETGDKSLLGQLPRASVLAFVYSLANKRNMPHQFQGYIFSSRVILFPHPPLWRIIFVPGFHLLIIFLLLRDAFFHYIFPKKLIFPDSPPLPRGEVKMEDI